MVTWSIRDPIINRVSWGALFAGFFFGFGAWLLLLALGAGIGLASFDPRNVSNWQGLGVGFGIWGVIAGVISMFLAGWLAARLSAADEKVSGVMHGMAVWGLMIVAGLWIAAMAVARTAGGAANVAGGAAQAAAQAAGQAAQDPSLRQDAQRQLEQQGQAVQQQAQEVQRKVQQNAGQIAETAKEAGAAGAWGFFVYGLLTLVAAALGGGVGVPRERRVIGREAPATTTGPLTPSPTRA
jgi:hypothetical protein